MLHTIAYQKIQGCHNRKNVSVPFFFLNRIYNLNQGGEDLYSENYKTLMKETEV